MLLGSLFTYFLGGIFAMQLVHYYTHYSATDRLLFKLLVTVAACAEIAHLIVSTHLTYVCLAENFANPMALLISPYSALAIPALNGIVGFCTHAFFTWRIAVMTKTRVGKLVAACVFMTAFVALSGAIATTIRFCMPSVGRSVAKANIVGKESLATWLSATAACDLFISITIVTLLVSARKITDFSPSRGVLNLLIAHTIENGAITTVCATADQIAFFALPPFNLTYLCLNSVLGRLYAIVLLTSLNGRESARQRLNTPSAKMSNLSNGDARNTSSMQMSAFSANHIKSTQTQDTNTASFPVIAVTTDIETRSADGMHHDHKMYP